MTFRRKVSTGIQTNLAAIILRDPTLSQDKYKRFGVISLNDIFRVDDLVEYKVFQQRPYSTAFLQMHLRPDEYYWAIGNSKCIGMHKGRQRDEWDPVEGMRLAIARAATDLAEQIGELSLQGVF